MKVLKVSIIILVQVIFLFGVNLYAEADNDKGKDTEKEKLKSQIEEWRETLQFGIDSEIIDVIKKIKELKERSLDELLLEIFKSTTNDDIKRALIDIFAEEKNIDAYDGIVKILANFDEETNNTVLSALNYIRALSNDIKKGKLNKKLGHLKEVLRDIIDYGDKAVASSAVRILGVVGDKSIVEYLLEKYEDSEVRESIKNSIVLALGDLKSKKALDKLIEIVKNRDESRVLRMYACESLGKIGDKKAIPAIQSVFHEKDALLRAYAASSLAMFEINDKTLHYLMDGLKDSNWRVRVQSAKALAKVKSAKAIPILRYKVLKDPIKQVKVESLKALGAIDGKKAEKIIVEVFKNKKVNYILREEALRLLAGKNLDNYVSVVKEVLNGLNPKYDSKFIQGIARIVAQTKSKKSKELLMGMFDSNDPVVRIYGIRGAVLNKFSDMRDIILRLSEDDPVQSVKREALSALERLK